MVEAFCATDQPWFADAHELVSTADAVVRVTATGPSRAYEIRPDPPADGQVPGIAATAITVRVTQVVKGDLAVGDEVEVNQGTCTDRPLPTGPGTDYVLALSGHDGHPWGQLNDDQAAWQVDATGGLHPVSPDDDLGIEGLEEVVAVAGAVAPGPPSGDADVLEVAAGRSSLGGRVSGPVVSVPP